MSGTARVVSKVVPPQPPRRGGVANHKAYLFDYTDYLCHIVQGSFNVEMEVNLD